MKHLIFIFVLVMLNASCRFPSLFYHNRVDPIFYPTERPAKSFSVAAGYPLVLGASYQHSKNVVSNAYVHTIALKNKRGALPESNNYKLSGGLSGNLVKKIGYLNISAGLGMDAGKTVGSDEANLALRGSRDSDLHVKDHELHFWQYYAQAALGLEFKTGVGCGVLAKRGVSHLNFLSGTSGSLDGSSKETNLSGKSEEVFYTAAALVLTIDSEPMAYQLHLASGSWNRYGLNTSGSISLHAIYTFN
jgi:hypothetical protein